MNDEAKGYQELTSGPTQECPYCASIIAKKASKCPKCGEYIRRHMSIILGLGIFIIPVIFAWFTLRRGHSTVVRIVAFGWLVFCLYAVFGGTPKHQLFQQETSISVLSGKKPPTQETLITLDKFNSIKTGMSYREVTNILGKEGTLMSENSIAGISTAMYQWSNGFSNMNAIFQNDKLIQKAQFGLK
jgi:hypothetical protein